MERKAVVILVGALSVKKSTPRVTISRQQHTTEKIDLMTSDNKQLDGLGPALEGMPDDELELSEGVLDSMLDALDSKIEQERGIIGSLRSFSTLARLVLSFGFSLLLLLVIMFFAPRSDLHELPWWRTVIVWTSTSMLLLGTIWYALRPAYLPQPAKWAEYSILFLSILGIILLCILPALNPMPDEPGHWLHAFGCMYSGLVMGIPVFLLIRLFDRGGYRGSDVYAALAAGLYVNTALSLHCGMDNMWHYLSGHLPAALIFVVGVLITRVFVSRFSPSRDSE